MNTSGQSPGKEWASRGSEFSRGQSRRKSNSPPARITREGPPEWCLHAQLTISHPKSEPVKTTYVARGIGGSTGTCTTSNTLPKDKWATTGSNVQFQYSWSNCDKETFTEVVPDESGIQKFESWPRRAHFSGNPGNSKLSPGKQQHASKQFGDSGYSTEQNYVGSSIGARTEPSSGPFPQQQSSSGFRARVIQPYGRRCISTCTITLSNEPGSFDSDFQGISDTSKFSFSSENLSNVSRSTNTTVVAPAPTRILVKDAETQTFSSPPSESPRKQDKACVVHKNDFTSIAVNPDTAKITGLNNFHKNGAGKIKEDRCNGVGIRSVQAQQPPTKNGTQQHHSSRQSFRVPPTTSPTVVRRAKSSPPIRYQQKSNQPRTVHIDVYCTGSSSTDETETTALTTDEDNWSSAGTSSTPQTVYNTTQYKIQHQRHKSGYPEHYLLNTPEKKLYFDQIKKKLPPGKKEDAILNNISMAHSNREAPQIQNQADLVGGSKDVSDRSDTGSTLSTTYPASSVLEDRGSRGTRASSNSSVRTYDRRSESSSTREKVEHDIDQHSDLDEDLLTGNYQGEGVNDQWWLQYLFSKFDSKGINKYGYYTRNRRV